MCKYIAPLVQNNSGLKKGSVANAKYEMLE